MRPRKHLIYGSLFALACFFLFAVVGVYEALIIWVCSWLIIDLDHVTRYLVRTGNFSYKRFLMAAKDFEKKWKKLSNDDMKKYTNPFFVLHGIESLIVLFLLSFRWDFFFWCFIGFLFHMILDWVNLYVREENVWAKVSVIYALITSRGKKNFE